MEQEVLEKIQNSVGQEIGNPTNNCIFVMEMKNPIEMKKLPEVDESQLGGNPFAQKLIIPVTEIISKVDLTKNEEGVVINKVLYAEKTQKVEIYYHENSGDNVAGLSDKAQRLFLHILYTLKPKKDYIRLNTEHYMMRNKIKSHTTVSNAIKELVRYEYIVKSCITGVYWINPYRFFPGSRLMKYPDNRVVVGETWDQTKGVQEKSVKTSKKKAISFHKDEESQLLTIEEVQQFERDNTHIGKGIKTI